MYNICTGELTQRVTRCDWIKDLQNIYYAEFGMMKSSFQLILVGFYSSRKSPHFCRQNELGYPVLISLSCICGHLLTGLFFLVSSSLPTNKNWLKHLNLHVCTEIIISAVFRNVAQYFDANRENVVTIRCWFKWGWHIA